jgi:hypothetical protein
MVDVKGGVCGVEYSLHHGLLDVQLRPHQTYPLVEFLRSSIKSLVRREKPEAQDLVKVHRLSRMCFEVLEHDRITNIDKMDGQLLYEAPQDADFEWVFKVFNDWRDHLRHTDCSIVIADHVAKSIDDIMTS